METPSMANPWVQIPLLRLDGVGGGVGQREVSNDKKRLIGSLCKSEWNGA